MYIIRQCFYNDIIKASEDMNNHYTLSKLATMPNFKWERYSGFKEGEMRRYRNY